MARQLDRNPSRGEFYPIDLRRIIEDVLHWRLDEVAAIGWTPDLEPILGRCEYSEKRILLATDPMPHKGERAYTVAHEIGHATMHKYTDCEIADHERTRALRRAERRITDPAVALEIEADAFACELLMPEEAVRKQFELVFGHKNVWINSHLARNVLQSHTGKRRATSFAPADAFEVARAAASYAGEAASSLITFFGTSAAATARRLLELGLIY
jgi:hypothetical protein